MYYLELTQRFWDFNKKRLIGSTGVAMYLYLLKVGFDNDRYDFKISDVTLSKELGLTNKTIKLTKEKLRSFGLIQCQTRNGFPCSYRLLLDYPLEISAQEEITSEKCEAEKFTQELIELDVHPAKVFPVEFTPDNTDLYLKIMPSQIKMSSQSQLPAPIKKTNNKLIPNFEEFIEYAKSLENYEVGLDSEIQIKYDSWVGNGWRNSSERLITNWRSSLKSALPFMKKSDKKEIYSIQSIPNIKRP